LTSYHLFNERSKRDELLDAIRKGDVAVVTDAGTPGIADPARDIVRAALEAGLTVSPIPGASALATAASASGLIDGPFIMLGFLPRSGTERKVAIGKAAASGMPLICFESPNRLADTLEDLRTALGDRDVTVMRELTKLHEEIVGGTLSSLHVRFASEPARGEIVIVVAGSTGSEETGEGEAEEIVRRLLASGMKASEAAREAASMTGLPRSDLYAIAQRLKTKLL
jgi:16S rRNA (cytidine1402-2'-O)-methyltransferase